MADAKISGLPSTGGITDATLIEVVDDPGGTPASAKATIGDVAGHITQSLELGQVNEVAAGDGITVDDSDPTAPIVALDATSLIVVVDSASPVTRPDAAIVLWLDDDTNAIAGDWRPA